MTKFIAHRGIWNKKIKDNSYIALKRGLESSKYIGIECDVRVTKDGKYILYHDSLYKGKLVKNTYFKEFKDVATLESILSIKTSKIILLELKDFQMNITKFLKFLKKYKRNIYLMSFDNKIIKNIRKYNVSYKLGVLNYVLNSDSNYDFDFICLLDLIATDYVLSTFKKRNIQVIIYGTINTNKNLIYIIDDQKHSV